MDCNTIKSISEAYANIQESYTAQGNARIGSTPAKATDKSVSSAVDKALANKGTAVSASSQKGKTGVTGGGSFQMSGGGKSKPAPTGGSRPAPTSGARPTPPARRVQNTAASSPSRGGTMRMDTMSDIDTYNLVLEYLIDKGFASTEQTADKIILNMSESWFQEIVEGEEVQTVSEEESDRAKDKHLERGGMGARKDHDRPSAKKATNAELGIKSGKTWAQKQLEKKYGKGASAMDIVKAEMEKKYGKGAVMSPKKKD